MKREWRQTGHGAGPVPTMDVATSDLPATVDAAAVDTAPLRIAVLVKQIPAVEEMQLDEHGRLIREGADLEMSAFCRRAVSISVDTRAVGARQLR